MAIKILGNIKSLTDTLYIKLTNLKTSISETPSDQNVLSEKAVADALDDKVDKETGKGLSSNDFDDDYKDILDSLDNDLPEQLTNKVDKVIGKGLSSNDYTDEEKSKLTGIEAGANNYVLTAASTSVLGGVKVGSNLNIDNDGVLSATDTTYNAATTSADGLMSSADKSKLDGIASGANNYSLPIATSSTLGGIKVGDNLTINDGVLSTHAPFNSSALEASISSLDTNKQNISSLETDVANKGFIKETAVDTKLGSYATTTALNSGLADKQNTLTAGSNITISSNGTIAATNTTYDTASKDNDGLMSSTDKSKLDSIETSLIYTTVEDNLTSISTTNALSAAQGAALKTQIDNLVSRNLAIKVVGELPTTDIDPACMYLKSNGASDTNAYDEYVYLDNKWELIGTRQIDISNKVEQGEVTSQLEFTFIDSETELTTIKAKGGEYATLELGDLYVEDVTSSTV